MSVKVEVYPSGITEVYTGGTISTTARVELVAAIAHAANTGGAVLVLAETSSEPDDKWPPSWFGSIRSERTDTAARTEEILHAGFGRDDHR